MCGPGSGVVVSSLPGAPFPSNTWCQQVPSCPCWVSRLLTPDPRCPSHHPVLTVAPIPGTPVPALRAAPGARVLFRERTRPAGTRPPPGFPSAAFSSVGEKVPLEHPSWIAVHSLVPMIFLRSKPCSFSVWLHFKSVCLLSCSLWGPLRLTWILCHVPAITFLSENSVLFTKIVVLIFWVVILIAELFFKNTFVNKFCDFHVMHRDTLRCIYSTGTSVSTAFMPNWGLLPRALE